MDSRSKALIVAAFVTTLGAIVVALINRSADTSPTIADTSPTISAATCDPIPAVEERTPRPSQGFVWVPTDFKLSSGKLEAVLGHWERKKADGKNKYIPGHWEIGTGRCVWVRGKFVAQN
jgi:hypothetical protein